VVEQRLEEEKGFRLDVEETVSLARHHEVRGLFLCNPNNPTGELLPFPDVEKMVELLPHTLIVLDQAYSSFTSDLDRHPDLVQRGNVILLHSLTKDFALGGIRLGYVISHPEIIRHLDKVLPPWNVNVVAQKAGLAALGEEEYVNQCSTKLKVAKEYLLSELRRLGLSPLPSETNYFLLKVGRATEFRRKLLSKKILVRDCTSFGLPQYIRIGVRTLPECQRLVEAVDNLLTHC
jgi:histidinol-phosphate aminotransferase